MTINIIDLLGITACLVLVLAAVRERRMLNREVALARGLSKRLKLRRRCMDLIAEDRAWRIIGPSRWQRIQDSRANVDWFAGVAEFQLRARWYGGRS